MKIVKILKIVSAAFGLLILFSIQGHFNENPGAFIFGLLIGVVLIYLGVRKKKDAAETQENPVNAAETQQNTENDVQTQQPPIEITPKQEPVEITPVQSQPTEPVPIPQTKASVVYEDLNTRVPYSGTKVKRQKGKSLLQFPNSYVVIDLETTGLSPTYNKIIEIAALKISRGTAVDRFTSLINPNEQLPSNIVRLTGITQDMVDAAPQLSDVLPQFLDFVGDSIVVGHNVNFDIGFINEAVLKATGNAFGNNFVDTMRLSRRLFPEEGHHRLKDLVSRFGISDNVEHRAMSDVLQTNECLQYMRDLEIDSGNEHEIQIVGTIIKSVKLTGNRGKDMQDAILTTSENELVDVKYDDEKEKYAVENMAECIGFIPKSAEKYLTPGQQVKILSIEQDEKGKYSVTVGIECDG